MQMRYNQALKMDLMELRRQINLNKKHWKHILTTNCYAYALGLDIPERRISNNDYFPGMISNFINKRPPFYTYSELLQGLYADLEALGIEIREIGPNEEIAKGEWKIALFAGEVDMMPELFYRIHFLRQRKNGIWYHKKWYKRVSNKDDNHQIITNPEACYFEEVKYQNCFCLTRKR